MACNLQKIQQDIRMNQTINFALQILILSISGLAFTAQADGLSPVQDFRIEAKESSEIQAPILVLFMSTSCPYCEIALQDFLLPMQRDPEYKNKVILRQIEIGSAEKLVDFNGKITSQGAFARARKIGAVPTVMLFDSKGQVLTSIVGLLTVDFYLAYLDNAINDSQAKIKATVQQRQ
jgi:thioredoxin-related protein